MLAVRFFPPSFEEYSNVLDPSLLFQRGVQAEGGILAQNSEKGIKHWTGTSACFNLL